MSRFLLFWIVVSSPTQSFSQYVSWKEVSSKILKNSKICKCFKNDTWNESDSFLVINSALEIPIINHFFDDTLDDTLMLYKKLGVPIPLKSLLEKSIDTTVRIRIECSKKFTSIDSSSIFHKINFKKQTLFSVAV